MGEVTNHWSWKNSCPLPLSLSHRQLGGRSAIKLASVTIAGTRQPVPLQMKSSKVPLVVIMFLYAINVGALMSLQAPFYPLEAQKKGATPAEVRYYLRSFKNSMMYELKTCPLLWSMVSRSASPIWQPSLCHQLAPSMGVRLVFSNCAPSVSTSTQLHAFALVSLPTLKIKQPSLVCPTSLGWY